MLAYSPSKHPPQLSPRHLPSPSPTSSHFTTESVNTSHNDSPSSSIPTPTSSTGSLSQLEHSKTVTQLSSQLAEERRGVKEEPAMKQEDNPSDSSSTPRTLPSASPERCSTPPTRHNPSRAITGGRAKDPSSSSSDGVNPLFSLSERISAGDLDPARVLVQKNGVVVREGAPGFLGGLKQAAAQKREKERVLGSNGHGHWFHRNHHPGMNRSSTPTQGTAKKEGAGEKGTTLRLNEHPEPGQASQVTDFRDHPDEQDHLDALKLRMRSAKGELQDRLEEGGWVTPEREEEKEVLEPRLAAMLERKVEQEEDEEELTNGASSVYSTAASETPGPESAAESLPLTSSSLIRRSESPVSYATNVEAPVSQPLRPATSSSRLSPLAEEAPSLTPSLAASPEPTATSSSLSPSRSRNSLRPNFPQPEFRSTFAPTASTSAVPHPPTPVELSPTSTTFLAPPSNAPTGLAPPSMRRSNTTPSSPTPPGSHPSSPLAPPAGVLPYITSSLTPLGSAANPTGPNPRRSSAAASAGRMRGSSLSATAQAQAHRSNSFSPASLSRPTHLQFHNNTSHTSSYSASPPIHMDVESSIALQAEAIRRQRAEKREQAEKEQQRIERDRDVQQREKDRERRANGGSFSHPPTSPLPVPEKPVEKERTGLGMNLAGPGALLKRRSTRMGSGSSLPASSVDSGVPPSIPPKATSPPVGDEASIPAVESGRRSRQDKLEEEEHAVPGGAGVLVGNLIGTDHANYVLMYNMLTGIRIGVSRCQAKAKRPLTDADYTARHKFSFDIVGNELTPSVKYDFKFKDYAPWIFRELREYFYLDPSDYLISLTAKYILSELGSPGKSGSFFYFSRDYRFIIKTIRHTEHKFLRSILKDYHEYVKKNPHTLISRFYGLHRVKLPHGKKIHFVIMNNLFPPHRDIHETYDLKGSAIGRLYPEDKAAQNPHAVLKDLNWVTRHRQLALGPEKKALFEEQLRRDTELLQRLGIMDYSLLTGIHNGVRGNSDGLREDKLSVFQPNAPRPSRKPTQVKRDADASALRKAVQRSDPQALGVAHELPEQDTSERRLFLFYQDEGGMRATGENNEDLGVIYYLGIIDILTPYTIVKRLEHFWKGLQHDKHMISPVHPREYGDRFLAFVKSVIRGNDESLRPRMFEHKKEEQEQHNEQPPPNVSEDDAAEKQRREEREAAVMREKEQQQAGKAKAQ
ncbi:hypothetical protein JCM11641_006098 [Rhodosporidiobolus odoratus]